MMAARLSSRAQSTVGGRHEIGQKPPYKEQSLSFTMPKSQTVKWEDHFSEDLGSANFLPMLLDVHNGMAYLVATPMGCLSYNKWGRPNPPYVVFKYDSKTWQRIALTDLPSEIKTEALYWQYAIPSFIAWANLAAHQGFFEIPFRFSFVYLSCLSFVSFVSMRLLRRVLFSDADAVQRG